MTTITREQQKQILIDTANHVISRDNTSPYSENLRELARIALASMDAEPVRYLNKFSGVCVTLEQQPNAADDVAVYMPLYAAPPAQPAPVVLTDEQREQLRQMDDEIVAELESEEIACRAAMLLANQRDLSQPVDPQVADYEKTMLQAGNSPVIPDGWALVPIVPTEDMVINGFESEPDPHFSDEKVWAEYEALSGCRRAARRAELCWAAMIKAAPKPEGNNK
ncbi:TPA: hypothetical protein ACTAD0_004490 [Salmonella enterica subsp. enterica]